MCSFFKCIFACLLPPLAVLIDQGCNCELCLNLFLTCLGYVPGCIHAYCVICREKPQYIQGVPQVTIVNNQPPSTMVTVQPMAGQHMQPMQQPFNYPPGQPYFPNQAGPHMAYPMAGQQQPQMMAPPAYDNPSAPNEYNFKQKFDD